LHLAAYHGHVNVLLLLTSELRDIDEEILNIPDSEGRSPLELTTLKNRVNCAQILINYGADPAQENKLNKQTALHAAACRGHTEVMQVVIEGMLTEHDDGDEEAKLKRFINAKDEENKCTALMYSVTNGHSMAVGYLLSQNADLWPIDKFGCTAVHRSAVAGNEDILSSLLEYAEEQAFPIESADSDTDEKQQLQGSKFGDIVGARSYNGRTALHFAAIRGNSAILESLLQLTNAVNVIDRSGYTPLHYACLEGHDACVEALLNHESFYEFNGSTFSPLHCAVLNDNEPCADRLLEIMGEDIVNLKDRKGQTPLFISASADHIDCIKFLLIHQAEVDSTDYKQTTPLMVATYYGHVSAVEELLQANADCSLVDHKKNTALHTACLGDDTGCASLLLDHITDHAVLDAQNEEGKTALHIAAKRGFTDIVMKLIELGSSIELDDNEGLTPMLACAPSPDVADCLDLLMSVMLNMVKKSTGATSRDLTNISSIRESLDQNAAGQRPKRMSSIYFSSSSPKSSKDSKAAHHNDSTTANIDSDSETY